MKSAINIILLLSLSACSGAPWMKKIMDGPPLTDEKARQELPPLYVKGWQEGCETGISANTNSMAKFRYKFQQDANFIMNDTYYRGWKDAFDYCQRYTRMYYSRQFP